MYEGKDGISEQLLILQKEAEKKGISKGSYFIATTLLTIEDAIRELYSLLEERLPSND
jgi:hypothetical protein